MCPALREFLGFSQTSKPSGERAKQAESTRMNELDRQDPPGAISRDSNEAEGEDPKQEQACKPARE